MVLECKIAEDKKKIAAKFDQVNYEEQTRHRLHQKSIFHPKTLQKDMPPGFWAAKLTSGTDAHSRKKQNEIMQCVKDFVENQGDEKTEELVKSLKEELHKIREKK